MCEERSAESSVSRMEAVYFCCINSCVLQLKEKGHERDGKKKGSLRDLFCEPDSVVPHYLAHKRSLSLSNSS